jgi:hypothetical protein
MAQAKGDRPAQRPKVELAIPRHEADERGHTTHLYPWIVDEGDGYRPECVCGDQGPRYAVLSSAQAWAWAHEHADENGRLVAPYRRHVET